MNIPEKINRFAAALMLIGSVLCCLFSAQVMWWAIDRDAPFVMLDYKVQPAFPGKSTVVKAVVRRDLSRRCNVMFSRSFLDSRGTRFELSDGAQLMNSTALSELNRRSPDTLTFNVEIPKDAAQGVGSVMTALDYSCNPVHQVYPIAMVLVVNLEVL